MIKKATDQPSFSLHNAGFTLIESAVVLTIIALIIGGVLVGKDMLTSSKYRKIAVYAQEYTTAIAEFQDKYGALPGDMATATRIWGRADDTTGTANVMFNCTDETSIANLSGTCNGNGDRTIARDFDAAFIYETFRAWQQLSHAGFIKGRYTGAHDGVDQYRAVVGQNIPGSDLPQAGYDIIYISDGAIPAGYFSGTSYHHVLHFGKQVSTNNLAHAPVLPAAEAYGLDKKIDDGMPGQGKLLSLTNADCVSDTDPLTGQYNLANTSGEHCTLVFITGF